MSKICPVCGKEFIPKNARQIYCSKDCYNVVLRDRRREYRKTHKEEIKQYNREYNKKHRELIRERSRNYYDANIERLRKYHREYQRKRRNKNRLIEACSKEHNNCFDCPTKDGECLYE